MVCERFNVIADPMTWMDALDVLYSIMDGNCCLWRS